MRRSLILDVVVRLVFHSAFLLGLFLLFTGHNRPGGGFVGGLVAGAAISLRYVAGGIDEVRDTLPLRPWTLLGLGLVIATSTALGPLLFGRQLMEHAKLDLHLGLGQREDARDDFERARPAGARVEGPDEDPGAVRAEEDIGAMDDGLGGRTHNYCAIRRPSEAAS